MAKNFRVKMIVNTEKLSRMTVGAANAYKSKLFGAFFESAKQRVFDESVRRLAPMDTGDLRDSARMTVVENSPKSLNLEISFNTPYAAYIHDITGFVNWTTAGTGRNYLADPLFEYASMLPILMRKYFNQASGAEISNIAIASGTYNQGFSRRTGMPVRVGR
jgi:hypothetical protein